MTIAEWRMPNGAETEPHTTVTTEHHDQNPRKLCDLRGLRVRFPQLNTASNVLLS